MRSYAAWAAVKYDKKKMIEILPEDNRSKD